MDLLETARRLWRRWLTPRVLDPAFLRRAAANPVLRPFANRQGRQLYDLVAGFVYAQTLAAALETGLLEALRDGRAHDTEALAQATGLSPERAARLAQAAAAIGLAAREGEGYALAPLGAAALTAPGVREIVAHHHLFYADLADPVALLRGAAETRLGGFWAYVGGGEGVDAASAATYSRLMAVTQTMVAEETLAAFPFGTVRRLLDVGGGEGAFIEAAARAYPDLHVALFDLPAVAERASARLARAGLVARSEVHGGSFRADPLPPGCDAVSLVRVLYDHDDDTVAAILARVRDCLPPGGRVIVSEPMSGGSRPDRVGDAYFGFYTLAMTTGRPRAPEEHAALLAAAGFGQARRHRTRQPFVTSVLSARRI